MKSIYLLHDGGQFELLRDLPDSPESQALIDALRQPPSSVRLLAVSADAVVTLKFKAAKASTAEPKKEPLLTVEDVDYCVFDQYVRCHGAKPLCPRLVLTVAEVAEHLGVRREVLEERMNQSARAGYSVFSFAGVTFSFA